jgi:hypothetical protein
MNKIEKGGDTMWLIVLLTWLLAPSAPAEALNGDCPFTAFFAQEGYEGINVRSVTVSEGHIIVDVCGGIMRIGGNAAEREMVEGLLTIASEMEGVKSLTVLIEGRLRTLTEGRRVWGWRLDSKKTNVQPHPFHF